MFLPKTLETTFERSPGSYWDTYSAIVTGLEILTDPGTDAGLVIDRPGQGDIVVKGEITVNGYLE